MLIARRMGPRRLRGCICWCTGRPCGLKRTKSNTSKILVRCCHWPCVVLLLCSFPVSFSSSHASVLMHTATFVSQKQYTICQLRKCKIVNMAQCCAVLSLHVMTYTHGKLLCPIAARLETSFHLRMLLLDKGSSRGRYMFLCHSRACRRLSRPTL